ncbi:MAG: RNase adapter RapZ [Deltaproteobacteria bacterium]|nr:RNase adapter RapZ [Deltaproteobacteria bacterium]
MPKAHVVVVTGLSGSGKSTAIKSLEDLGFFCIDNLPVVLLDKFLTLAEQQDEFDRVALGIDVRERGFLDLLVGTMETIRGLGHRLDVIFLDASDDVLIRRYSETRRRHPLGSETSSLAADIELERKMLSDVRTHAGWVIDTTDLNVHQLKSLITKVYDPKKASSMTVSVVSFGFKRGLPRAADYVFDSRFLPNPYFVDELRACSGKCREVREFLESGPEWGAFLSRIEELLKLTIPRHEEEGRPVLTVAVGCTGGRHRSVAVVEALARRLKHIGLPVRLTHRDIDREA